MVTTRNAYVDKEIREFKSRFLLVGNLCLNNEVGFKWALPEWLVQDFLGIDNWEEVLALASKVHDRKKLLDGEFVMDTDNELIKLYNLFSNSSFNLTNTITSERLNTSLEPATKRFINTDLLCMSANMGSCLIRFECMVQKYNNLAKAFKKQSIDTNLIKPFTTSDISFKEYLLLANKVCDKARYEGIFMTYKLTDKAGNFPRIST